ncbi:hypothetical protein JNB88_32885 [Rhizobium cauense]|nr:hypothetical protein [Rhizobium cauense]MBW9118397.1 hypothetical protein [Rhizobium cauense]
MLELLDLLVLEVEEMEKPRPTMRNRLLKLRAALAEISNTGAYLVAGAAL